MAYKYKMVQVPSTLKFTGDPLKFGGAAAAFLQEVVDREAIDSWEFYRVDSLAVVVAPGCLGALSGQKEAFTNYSVISFRRQI